MSNVRKSVVFGFVVSMFALVYPGSSLGAPATNAFTLVRVDGSGLVTLPTNKHDITDFFPGVSDNVEWVRTLEVQGSKDSASLTKLALKVTDGWNCFQNRTGPMNNRMTLVWETQSGGVSAWGGRNTPGDPWIRWDWSSLVPAAQRPQVGRRMWLYVAYKPLNSSTPYPGPRCVAGITIQAKNVTVDMGGGTLASLKQNNQNFTIVFPAAKATH